MHSPLPQSLGSVHIVIGYKFCFVGVFFALWCILTELALASFGIVIIQLSWAARDLYHTHMWPWLMPPCLAKRPILPFAHHNLQAVSVLGIVVYHPLATFRGDSAAYLLASISCALPNRVIITVAAGLIRRSDTISRTVAVRRRCWWLLTTILTYSFANVVQQARKCLSKKKNLKNSVFFRSLQVPGIPSYRCDDYPPFRGS